MKRLSGKIGRATVKGNERSCFWIIVFVVMIICAIAVISSFLSSLH